MRRACSQNFPTSCPLPYWPSPQSQGAQRHTSWWGSGVGDQASGSVGSGFGTATATGHSAFGVGFGSSATIFQKKGDGLAIYVEPDQLAAR